MKGIVILSSIVAIFSSGALAIRDAAIPPSYGLVPTCKKVASNNEDDPPPPTSIPCKPVGTDACDNRCINLPHDQSRMTYASNKRGCAALIPSECLNVMCRTREYSHPNCTGHDYEESEISAKHCGQSTF